MKRWTWEEIMGLSPQAVADLLNGAASAREQLRELLEQWRLEELREREDFPDEARKLARCSHQLHAIVERFRAVARPVLDEAPPTTNDEELARSRPR